jgi:hypothetical protein
MVLSLMWLVLVVTWRHIDLEEVGAGGYEST